MTPNEAIARKFAEQFTPQLTACRTERINNVPMPDAWVVSHWDDTHKIGITAVAHSGALHAFIEAAGSGDIAEHAGEVIARALGLFAEKDDNGKTEG
jgi:hypothetical protein